jgi:hypothetical protein
MLTRRTVLGTALAVPGLAMLAACASHPDAEALASKTKLAADAFAAFAATVTAFGIKIPDSVVAQVEKLAQDVSGNADKIATALDPASVYQEIVNDARAVGALLAPYYVKAPRLEAAFEAVLNLILDTAAQFGLKGA